MASKLDLLLIAFAFLFLCSSHYCSASGRSLNPKMAVTTEFGLDPPYLLKPTFPLPEDEETQTPPSSTLPMLPMPLQQPITPPPAPPPFPAGQDGVNLTPAFPFPQMPSIPELPSIPLPPQFVDSGFSSSEIGNEDHAGGDRGEGMGGKGKSGSGGTLGMSNGGGGGIGMFGNGGKFFISPNPFLALILSNFIGFPFSSLSWRASICSARQVINRNKPNKNIGFNTTFEEVLVAMTRQSFDV
ncbi:hypothetical protein NC653_028276 [Populus alba x Populus x berolinensis]|uniref:Uncharacterized protein n=1 Tax=Populus alba x Populus x berolinensis TaxID=444605 RepID=A0AAD6M7K4_9ROSI|nr:hypothetical protein NC653_028276 [Populus alba x Populus x berolinensis]